MGRVRVQHTHMNALPSVPTFGNINISLNTEVYRSAFISQRLFHFRFTLEVQLTSVMTIECKFCFLTLLSHFGLLSHFAITESERQENTKNTDHLAFSLLSHFALSLGQK